MFLLIQNNNLMLPNLPIMLHEEEFPIQINMFWVFGQESNVGTNVAMKQFDFSSS